MGTIARRPGSVAPAWFYARRIAGGHHDHRHPDLAAAAGRPVGSRSGPTGAMLEQRQAAWPCPAQLSHELREISAELRLAQQQRRVRSLAGRDPEQWQSVRELGDLDSAAIGANESAPGIQSELPDDRHQPSERQGITNSQAVGTNLAIMLCPSDTYNRTAFNGSTSSQRADQQPGQFPWARGNYGANAAEGFMTVYGARSYHRS